LSLSEDKQSKRNKNKFVLSFLALLLVGTLGFFYWQTNDQRAFTRLSKEMFTSRLASDTLDMHYTLAYPENYDIDYIPHLPVYSRERSGQYLYEQDELLIRLKNITPERLTDSDAYTYQLLLTRLENQQTGDHLYLYNEPLSPGSGIQSALPILLADYPFRNVRDVTDYLTILDQIDDYLAGLILFEQDKAAAGLFMSTANANRAIEQLDRIMDKNLLTAGTHFLQSTFLERVDLLLDKGEITTTEKDFFVQENNRILLTVIQPAYIKTGDELYLLINSGTNDMGLAYFPEGQTYYQHLLSRSTGSYRSVDEIKQLLYKDFLKNYDALIDLTTKHPDLAEAIKGESLILPLDSPTDILRDLQQKISDNYPAFPVVDHQNELTCVVKNVSSSMEAYTSPAYYLTPSIDSYGENTIYINQKNNTNGLFLYTTLAHEGYPGHLYQTVYHHSYMEQTNGNLLRHILNYGGYLEGWAYYVEMDSYRYAKQLMADAMPESAYVYDYYRLANSLQIGLYSLLDIAIHYDGADMAQVGKILAIIGIRDEMVIQNFYNTIIADPTNYLKYYLGYLEILELKKEATNLWGAEYSDYRFHKFLLEAGPSDFYNLGILLRSGDHPS
ncbi:MAG: DUF885 domain-containing protein, partial [Lachnospiraceae bacterium]|nr:DUF885 domain-containing protein [Lachnospiraceae bacterium]